MRWKRLGEADVKGPRQLERWQEPHRAESRAQGPQQDMD